MFVDFDKVFNSKAQTELKVPDALVKYLSSQLPEGMKYIVDKSGNCIITSETETCSIGGLIFRPTQEQKRVLGKTFTHNDVLAYMYNTQKPIKLEFEKEGYVKFNGHEIPIEKMSYNPLNPVKFISGDFFMYPQPFPKPFVIKIGCEKYEREVRIRRVPNNSVYISAFESADDEALNLKLFVNEKKMSMKITLSYNMSYTQTVRDLVEIASIFNAYLDGKGKIFGKPLGANLDTTHVKKYDEESLVFWKKVLEIESLLNVTFIPPNEDVEFETICLVEELYQNLVKQTPIRKNKKIESLEGEWDMRADDLAKKTLGQSMYFEFQATSQVTLFGETITIPCLIGIFDALLSDYKREGEKYTLFLSDESENKKMYTSYIRFVTQGELEAFQNINHNEKISILHDAKRIQEYL